MDGETWLAGRGAGRRLRDRRVASARGVAVRVGIRRRPNRSVEMLLDRWGRCAYVVAPITAAETDHHPFTYGNFPAVASIAAPASSRTAVESHVPATSWLRA